MAKFTIYEGHMDALMKKITRIKNKCSRFGCDFTFEEIGEEFREIKTPTGDTMQARYVVVEADGLAVVNGWEFVASVEHTEKGNIFSSALHDVEIPKRYRNSAPFCEHCNSARRRKNTFIVRNTETNEFKQVGKSCLCDFTHGMSAEFASWLASMREIFEEAQSAPVEYARDFDYFNTSDVLAYCAETVRCYGFTKTRDEFGEYVPNSTRDRATDFLLAVTRGDRMSDKKREKLREEMKRVNFNAESEETRATVRDALQWLNEQKEESDYMHNLKTVCALDCVKWHHFGLIASLFPVYRRAMERAEEQARRDKEREAERCSEWQGEQGERITVNVKSCEIVTSWENCFNGYSCTATFLYKFADADGNIFLWKTQKYIDEDDKIARLVGTVKAHDEFRGVKQTHLTRCKIA